MAGTEPRSGQFYVRKRAISAGLVARRLQGQPVGAVLVPSTGPSRAQRRAEARKQARAR